MTEPDRKYSRAGKFSKENSQNTSTYDDDEGVDGELDEMFEIDSSSIAGKICYISDLPSTYRDANSKDSKTSKKHCTDHDHSSNHRDSRRRLCVPCDDGDQCIDEDYHIGCGYSKCHSESGEYVSYSTHITTLGDLSRFSHSKQDTNHGNQLHLSRQKVIFSGSGELPESHENPLSHTRYLNAPIQITNDKNNQFQLPMIGETEDDEAEDGEILEDGELTDDEVIVGTGGVGVSEDNAEEIPVSPAKFSSKGEKENRKKSDHKDKSKESHDKIKQIKLTDVDKLEEGSNTIPAWGSGYQGPKSKTSSFNNKESQYGRGSRGYRSPPGLYDSPSLEESDEEAVLKTLMTEGYIDASVAADEKEGIFYPKVSLRKRKRPNLERNDHKRKRNLEGKPEGPTKKKPLVDLALTDRLLCKFYMEGNCTKGRGCQFSHEVEKLRKMEVCKYHLTIKGCIKQRCLYMHEDFPCKYYHTGAKCYSGGRCKFSHDHLTEETRKALEMRVAAEDIINVEDPDYEYDHKPSESNSTTSKPSLLGSPPRDQQEVKKIPSLFEIEVHPPGQSPKPPIQATSRPSGFYSETFVSPKPGTGTNSNGPLSSPSTELINSSAPVNQQGLSNQGIMGGPGLLKTPLRPGNKIVNPMSSSRPSVMMNIQQGMNLQQHQPGESTPIQFLGPGQMNCKQLGGNLPPVLNMLGAIIREAAMQKGSGVSNNNMNKGSNSSILHNMTIFGPNINIVGPNIMQQGNVNSGPNSMIQNSFGKMPFQVHSSSKKNVASLQNIMGLSNIMRNMGTINNLGNIIPNNSMGPCHRLGPTIVKESMMGSQKNIGIRPEVGIMNVNYRSKADFVKMDKVNNDLNELDKILQQIQAQVDMEDEEGQGESDEAVRKIDIDIEMHTKNEMPDPVKTDSLQAKKDVRDGKAVVKSEVAREVNNLIIPANLPKKQRELFKRIQQQQLLREKEQKRQEDKAQDNDWCSSDEVKDCGQKRMFTSDLKILNQKPTSASSGTVYADSGIFSTNSSGSSSASTFNIMQIINTIKSQTTSNPLVERKEASSFYAFSKLCPSQNSHQPKENVQLSSALQPPVSASENVLDVHHPSISSLRLPEIAVDLPAVSAHSIKPLVYSIVKISLNVHKPYIQLPESVKASDPAFKDDPRVKWHLQYTEKLLQKMSQRKDCTDRERPQTQTDPQLKKKPSDPRLAKSGDSPNNGRGVGRVSDPRLQRLQAQSRPADPRLVRQVGRNLDLHLNCQSSQNKPDIFLSGTMNKMVDASMNSMGKQIEGVLSNVGSLMNQVGSPMNKMKGSVCSLIHNVGPMSNIGSPMNNMLGPINSQFSGPGRPLPGSGPVNNSMNNNNGSPINNNGGPMSHLGYTFNQSRPDKIQMNRMVGQGKNLAEYCNVIEGNRGNIWRGPMRLQNPNVNFLNMFSVRMNNSSGSRIGCQRTPNNPHCSTDPRLKNRHGNTQEQGTCTKKPISGVIDPHSETVSLPNGDKLNDSGISDSSNNCRSMQSHPRGQDGIIDNPDHFKSGAHILCSSGQYKMSQAKEEWAKISVCRIENSVQPSSLTLMLAPLQNSDANDKLTHRFDHRNDPRFKRVKRLVGQSKSNMEYSSMIATEDCQRDVCGGEDAACNDNCYPKLSTRHPYSRNVPSPSLPDTLQDFDLPHLAAVTVEEPEVALKVKDLFRTIDPAASPFC